MSQGKNGALAAYNVAQERPRPAHWLVQCAWCGRAKDQNEDPVDGPLPRPPDSHGICKACAETVMEEVHDGRHR